MNHTTLSVLPVCRKLSAKEKNQARSPCQTAQDFSFAEWVLKLKMAENHCINLVQSCPEGRIDYKGPGLFYTRQPGLWEGQGPHGEHFGTWGAPSLCLPSLLPCLLPPLSADQPHGGVCSVSAKQSTAGSLEISWTTSSINGNWLAELSLAPPLFLSD